ncbi:MAG TPA: TadE/TadG family type IV pilus assembly protein [Planctomycetaceae bacterium]|nr:TadE/TadG family type IV pilus assembly protein [Planctomycetaceae bacterium]
MRRRGAFAVEMAFAAPVLFLILFGILEVAHAFMVQHLIQDAARQGCRVAIRPRSTNAAVTNTIDRLLKAEGIDGATTTILVNNAAGDVSRAEAGADIRVKITLDRSNVALVPGGRYVMGQLSAAYSQRHQ